MVKTITISLGEEYIQKLEDITKHEYMDKTKLIRKLIDKKHKEIFKENKLEVDVKK